MLEPVYFTILDSVSDSALYETFIGQGSDEIPLKDLYPFIANSTIDVIENIQDSNSTKNVYNKSHLQQKVRSLLTNNINEAAISNNTSFYCDNFLNDANNSTSDGEVMYNNNPVTTLQQITNIPQGSLFLGTIDEYESYLITAYVTYNNTKFIIITDKSKAINYNSFKKFFMNVHELYIKKIMNPFNVKSAPITDSLFDCEVRVLGDMYILSSSAIVGPSLSSSAVV